MKTKKSIFLAILMCFCMFILTVPMTVSAEELPDSQARMQYIAMYHVNLNISSSGTANVSAALVPKEDVTSTSIVVVLQKLVGDSWASVHTFSTSGSDYLAIAEEYPVGKGSYLCEGTFRANTEVKYDTTVVRTYE